MNRRIHLTAGGGSRRLAAVLFGVLGWGVAGSAWAARPAGEGATPAQAPTAEETLQIRWLVGDLRDDPFRFNAMEAMWRLRDFGDAALPALREALASEDWQQRQMAAHLLRRMDPDPPGDAMLRVCVEGLANDGLPYGPRRRPGGRGSFTYVNNANAGVLYLIEHAAAAEPWLLEAIEGGDAQQRFLAAFVLGTAGRGEHAAVVADALLPHLEDNRIRGDGLMAGSALFCLGIEIEPHLRAARPTADEQAGPVIDLILRNLHDPPDTQEKLWARSPPPDQRLLSRRFHDPIYEYRFEGHGFYGIGGADR